MRRLVGWRPGPRTGPVALLLVSALGVAAAIWGGLFADPPIRVRRFDAGAVDRFAIGEVTTYEDIQLYIVGLSDGRLRALDGRVEASGCDVVYIPDEPRGSARNPGGRPGAYVDPCTDAAWSIEGHALDDGEAPLRTPAIFYQPGGDGALHVFVEMINHDAFP